MRIDQRERDRTGKERERSVVRGGTVIREARLSGGSLVRMLMRRCLSLLRITDAGFERAYT